MHYVRLISAVAVVAFIAFFTVARQRAIDPAVHERYGTSLARLQTLDHSLAEDLMRARTGLLTNYDPLVRTMAELRTIHDRLSVIPSFLALDGREALTRELARSSDGLERRAEWLETFKSENAVLLNSLRFLPHAADDLATRTTDATVIARIDALVRDVLLLNLWNDASRLRRVERELRELEASPAIPGPEMELLSLHAEVIAQRRPTVERLLDEIFALQDEHGPARLDALYRTHHAYAARTSARDEQVLFVLALACVVLGATFIILRIRHAAEMLRQTSEQLATAVDMKNRFVSMTSHEFRTPLSVILSSTELLEAYSERWKPEKKAEHYDRIRSSVHSMTQLIDGILLIGKGEAGVLDFKPSTVDLDRICREVVGAVQAKTGGARAIDYEPPEVHEVVADERLIRHVLDNLLSNALKYSPEGGRVALVARCGGREACLTISDEGLGIPESDRERLFESFRRGTNVGAIPGTGLGLAVVKRAIDLHRGRVEVISAVGAGTRFEVTLPVGGGQSS